MISHYQNHSPKWYIFMAIMGKSPQTINPGECVVRRESSYTVSKNVNWEKYGDSLKNEK